MPRRLPKSERKWVYRLLVERDGEWCQDCKLTPADLTLGTLDIDHVDEDEENWDEDNLALRCRSCNVAKGNRARSHSQIDMFPNNPNGPRPTAHPTARKSVGRSRAGGGSQSSPGVETCVCAKCVCEHTDVLNRTDVPNSPDGPGSANMRARRGAIDFESGSPEMHANGLYEDKARSWLVDMVAAHEALLKRDAINSGAEYVGCSPATIRRYIDKLTSLLGPLRETRDEAGRVVIVSRFGQGEDPDDSGNEADQGG